MLAVDKDNLIALTSQRVAQLREKELNYYVNHLGNVQTIATLIAGFAFTALVRMDAILLEDVFMFRWKTGAIIENNPWNNVTGATLSSPVKEPLDTVQWYAFVMQIGELFAVVSTLGEMILVVTRSLIARLLGTRLALRGPDGSIIRAARLLANSLSSCTRIFFTGLQYFLLSVVFHVMRTQHPFVAVFLLVVLAPYGRGMGSMARELAIDYFLNMGVNTAFDDTGIQGVMSEDQFHSNTRTDENLVRAAAAALQAGHLGVADIWLFSCVLEDHRRDEGR